MKQLLSKMALLLLPLGGFSSVAAAPFDEFDRFIESVLVEKKVPGLAVSIVEGDKVVFAKGYGVLRAGGDEKVDENTIFQLASISKTFTSGGLAVQVDAKRLGWDDEIITHMPAFALKDSYPTRYASARDLLAHRTGLPAFRGDLLGRLGYSNAEILRRIRFFEPASSFREKAFYSNIGFFAAGELLAAVSGMPFEEALKRTLLEPLQMTRTGFFEMTKEANASAGHAEIDGKIEVIPLDDQKGFAPAGGVMSTAADMGNWMVLQLNGGVFKGKQLIAAGTVKEMHKPSMVTDVTFTDFPPINDNAGLSYGLGWNNYHYNGKMIVEKGGALDGVRTIVTLIPELKAGITVLANLNFTIAPEIIRAKFLELYAGKNPTDPFEEIAKKKKELASLLKQPPKPDPVLPPSRSLLQYTGSFDNDLYGTFQIVHEGGTLVLEAGPSRWKGRLTHWSNDTFQLRWPAINAGSEMITFTMGPEGQAVELTTETLGVFKKRK